MGFCVPAPVIAPPMLHGLPHFRLLGPLFDHLHLAGTGRDRAGNRQWFSAQYATLLFVSFFHPTITSFRGLQQTTTLAQVHTQLGIRWTSLGALSEAASVCDAALLHQVLTSLRTQRRPHLPGADQAALAALTAVDGRLVPALPRMLWALWQDDQHRAAKRGSRCKCPGARELFGTKHDRLV